MVQKLLKRPLAHENFLKIKINKSEKNKTFFFEKKIASDTQM